ncbi:MAG TPA: GNAT family N-acetyltransferase [Chthonomonadaceae bacterium]|nr:GNAT family N-acetyltransferase [Chthonomonadaceae bacterium]
MLTHRPFTPDEALRLHEELKTTPNIFGYTVEELLRFRDVFVAEIEGAFAGTCVSKDLLFGWTDIAVLYVLPAYRGRGLGTELYTAAWERAVQRGRHIFTLSRSPEVIHLMERFGMKMTGAMWRAPLAVHLHMNRHMMSRYRIKEAIRKSRQMKSDTPLLSGVKRHRPVSGSAEVSPVRDRQESQEQQRRPT